MSTKIDNDTCNQIRKMQAKMTTDSICADINNKRIEVFETGDSLVESNVHDEMSEKELEAYNKSEAERKEKRNQTWKNVGIVTLGVATVVSGVLFTKKIKSKQLLKNNQEWKSLVKDLNSSIKPENYLGSGRSANVYKLNDNYVLRVPHGCDANQKEFETVADIFEGRNFGQPVAISKNGRVSINRFVNGEVMYQCGNSDPDVYLKKLKGYASLPDKTVEQLVDDIAFLRKKGYSIDCNIENFLYDSKTKRIGIVDINRIPKKDIYNTPYGHDWVVEILCNGNDFLNAAEEMSPAQKREMLSLIKMVEQRIIPMCERHGIPIAKYNNKDYCEFSMAELLHSIDRINPASEECLVNQLVRLNHPDLIRYLKTNERINY